MRRRLALIDIDTGEIVNTRPLRKAYRHSYRTRRRTGGTSYDRHVTFVALVVAIALLIAK